MLEQRERGIASILGLAALAAGALALALVLLSVLNLSRRPGPRPAPLAPVSQAQVVESGASVRDAAGGVWSPDRFAHGGALSTSPVPIADTEAPALYQSQRIGVRSIAVPLRTDGSYLVVLYFAEIAGAPPGGRVFDVLAQGRAIATVDVAREVGALAPYHLAFTVPVAHHRLTLDFRARRGEPMLSALRVTRVDPPLQLPAHRLVWSDEFEGPRGSPPDPARWRHDLGGGWGQQAIYTDQAANASLDGHGHLVLAARRETSAAGGQRVSRATSARLSTQGLFAMRYGSASARVWIAGEPGVVSTFWGLGTDVTRVGWPRSGEIDPLEGRGAQPTVLVQALHTQCPTRRCPVVWERTVGSSLAAGFHTFTVQRAPGVVTYLMDGRQTASLTAADMPRGAWVFDRPFFLVLNLIVGGWGGTPPASTHWPVRMLVDWVRVYG
jgi:beta-glucanase (GH16 family)